MPAVAEATFKTFKTEFINDRNFTSLIQLKLECKVVQTFWTIFHLIKVYQNNP
ncbi:hypothetical protein [Spiroplasma ixodetis]|uniref:hypothetical protein n=1 Tax=Spiroplasma ixodetis TaxID=2141 RepID=UPI002576F8DA|nr:hypothetical protein [Spiroplasma ixodetis]